MRKIFEGDSWDEYLYWQEADIKILKKINSLIKDIERNGANKGLGKPERLKGNLSNMYSRRINQEHRLTYYVSEENIYIVGCKTHYGDK